MIQLEAHLKVENYLLKKCHGCKLFCGLSDETLMGVFSNSDHRVEHYEAGDVISNGERPFGIIIDGTAVIKKVRASDTVVLRTISKNMPFGIAKLFCGDESNDINTVVFAKNKCEVLSFDVCKFEEQILCRTDLCRNFLKVQNERICFLNGKIDSFTAGTSEKKVIGYLLSQIQSGTQTVHLSVSFAKLASMLDMGRASLYRVFDGLEDLGLIRRTDKTVFIIDKDGLFARR